MGIFYCILLSIINFVGAWNGICPQGALKSTTNNVCFTFSSTTATWYQAQIHCSEQGANASNWDDFWIGATLTKVYNDAGVMKIWIWEGFDKLVRYDDWGPNEPSNKGVCAAVSTSNGMWFAEDCSIKKNYVCSIPVKVDICDDEWIYFPVTKFCYKVFYHSNWNTAESNCVAQGAHLVSVHDNQENLFIQDIAHSGINFKDNQYWQATAIGLYTTTNDNTKWNWSDGTPTDYVPWSNHQPDDPGTEKCGSVFGDTVDTFTPGVWNNMPCDMEMRNYVCKKLPAELKIM